MFQCFHEVMYKYHYAVMANMTYFDIFIFVICSAILTLYYMRLPLVPVCRFRPLCMSELMAIFRNLCNPENCQVFPYMQFSVICHLQRIRLFWPYMLLCHTYNPLLLNRFSISRIRGGLGWAGPAKNLSRQQKSARCYADRPSQAHRDHPQA